MICAKCSQPFYLQDIYQTECFNCCHEKAASITSYKTELISEFVQVKREDIEIVRNSVETLCFIYESRNGRVVKELIKFCEKYLGKGLK